MTIELANSPVIEFKNSKLKKYTEQIFKQGLNIKKAYARIAVTLVQIEDSQCYEMDGFTSVHDFSSQILGIKQSQSYALLKVGREFLDSKTFESVLAHDENNDYTTSQLQALLPLKSVTWAQELAADGTIDVSMTVKEIKDIVKEQTGKGKAEGEEGELIDVEPVEEDFNVDAYTLEFCIEFGRDENGKAVLICGDKLITAKEARAMIRDWQ